MVEQTDGTISILSTKMAKKDKDAYSATCKSRGVTRSTVTRKLIALWMAGDIKLEI